MSVDRGRRLLDRWRLTIGYLILVAAVSLSLHRTVENQERIDTQTRLAIALNCETSNDHTMLIDRILLVMLGEPDEDLDSDPAYENRLRLYNNILPLLQQRECPPAPPYDGG